MRTSIRYWWWLALGAVVLGIPACFFAGRYLAQCFQSSVVIGFPAVGQRDGSASASRTVLGSVDQDPAISSLVQPYGPAPAFIAQLETFARREFLRIQLSFDPIATTVPNSVALRITAKEKTPDAASALAVAAGQAVLDQAEARLIPAGSLPVSSPTPPPASTTVPTPVPAPAPASQTALPLRKTVTWRAAPDTPEAVETKRRLGDQLVDEENRRAKLQNDLGVLGAMPKVQVPRPSPMRPSNEAALKSELNGANNTLIELQNRYTNLHPDVVAAQQRVRDLQAALEQAINKNTLIAKQDAAVQVGFNEAHARLAREVSLQQQISQLDAQMAGDRAELDALTQSKHWIPVVRYSAPNQPAPAQPPPPPVHAMTRPAMPAPAAPLKLPHTTLTPTPPIATLLLPQPVLGLLSVLFGLFLAGALVALAEFSSRSVRDAEALEDELPYGVRFLGEIPRMTR
ncbi:MAG TPA: hypothetical protein VH250_08465 [Granulicella sp.]|nr:hypothetical protein [Granulicella sp.]